MKSPKQINPFLVGAVGLILICVSSVVWARADRVLGQDSFGYLELAKQFGVSQPTHFGDWWPFGFPLLGAVITRFGLSAYASLIVVSALAYFAMISCFWWGLPEESKDHAAFAVLAAASCAPVCPLLLSTILSEPLFSALLFCLALSLSRWPSPGAIAISMILAIAAFGVRYVGAFAIGLLPLWALICWNNLKKANSRTLFVVAYTVTLAAAGILCYLNYRHFGRITGPQPIGEERFSSWPRHLADFGWSPVAALASSGILRALGGISTPLCFIAGLTAVGVVACYLFRVWGKPLSAASGPMVLLIVCYSLAVVTLRACTPFDSVSSARTFLPVLFPLAYLIAADRTPQFRRLIKLTAYLFLVFGTLLAVRGISSEVKADIADAKAALKRVLKRGDSVAVNGDGRALAAYFDNRFQPVATGKDGLTPFWEATDLWDGQNFDFTVVVHPSRQQHSNETVKWEALISRAVSSGRARIVARNDRFVLLERTNRIRTDVAQ